MTPDLPASEKAGVACELAGEVCGVIGKGCDEAEIREVEARPDITAYE